MNEKSTGLFIFLVVFWSGVILLSTYFYEYTGAFTNADLDDLKTKTEFNLIGISIDLSPFANLIKIMTFNVNGTVPVFIGIILDALAVLTGFTVLALIFDR